MKLSGKNIGLGITGSFCTFEKIKTELTSLIAEGANVIPILSYNAATIDTRFGYAKDFMQYIESITGNSIVNSIDLAEPLGPKNFMDIMIIAPCTGNTLAKLCNGITDTPVLMAAKGHMRNEKPIVISVSTNDALGLNLKNIGTLISTKNMYFVPFGQDDFEKKPRSMISYTQDIIPTLEMALEGKQIQPIIKSPY